MIKFVKFFFSWLLTYGVNIWLTYFLINYLLLSKNISYFISILVITLLNFIISLVFTFKTSFSFTILSKYILILLFFSALNYILVILVKNYLNADFYLIIFVITTLIFFFKFIVYDKFVFKWFKENKSL